MTEGYLESRGIAYRTNEFKPGRPTLAFIHGLSGTLSVWFPFEAPLTTQYNVLTLDLRGHGKSRRYKKYKEYDLALFAEDIYVLLKELQIEQSVLISHSLGALVALELMHEHPEIVSKAIFISPAVKTNRLFLAHIKNPPRALAVFVAFLLAAFKKPIPRTDYSKFKDNGDWNLRRIFNDIGNMGQRSYLYSLNHLYAFAHETWWREIKIPTLFIHGTKDTMVPAKYAVAVAKENSSIKIKLVANKNHLLPMNSTEGLIQDIKDFIQ